MLSQWHVYAHIMKSRLEAHTLFYRVGAKLVGLEPFCSDAARPELFLKKFRESVQSEPMLRHLLFGSEHFSSLIKAIEPFYGTDNFLDLCGPLHESSQLVLDKSTSRSVFWKVSCFLNAYFSTFSSYFFEPKARGGNLPGLVLSEEILGIPVLWSAAPTPFSGRDVALEAKELLSLWSREEKNSLWVYCNLQSLCHRAEKVRSLKLCSFAKRYPQHMRFLQITVDSPLYLDAPDVLSLEELCQAVVREVSAKESLYRTSLSCDLQAAWVSHAIDVAESTKRWISEKEIQNPSRVFIELFSLALSRRWLGFSLQSCPSKKEVFVTHACRECIDRGATFIFELGLALSNLSVRELQALFWGRALIARGRLPYEIRMRGCRELFSAIDRKQVGVWLHEQLARGLEVSDLVATGLCRYE